ncbi:5-bromo-4-chloroindolyl phosphate hydrolysis family protein [Rhodobacter sp. KR11]|uniref:5-bromo-4-chloroindolyl phosphate hydrolysis family protein n=1 Tax=Rhodobacter sp. KR11 TaxID=2974588 RepID=UPI002222C53D|nr:5-bromo-4-chloroindolyl phosphate hydrolysis family protein [Rhodobacter sp. KR11]MCW1917342.1 5-bromo-4-chloroindolyl phosphate hydrolysis family protein [Rhodobacter sp. KR11]
MARRIVGKYSPGAATGAQQGETLVEAAPPPSGAGLKSGLLFALAFPFLFRAFTGGNGALFTGLAAAALMILAAWLTREGLKAEADYNARKVARRPAIPRKIFGAALTGAALMSGALLWQHNDLALFAIGMIGAALHLGSFGIDPLKNKGLEGVDLYQTDRVARAVAEAEATLTQMKDAILRARDSALETRVEGFAQAARKLFRQVENDPRDLTAARTYLSVYLQGARDATIKLADLLSAGPNPKARADYEALLSDLETTFAQRTEKLLSNDQTGLDIEIQVLRDRLKYQA